jgi:hypothetical protein
MTVEELLAEYAAELAEEPWLRAFIEPDDEDLQPADARWREAQTEAKVQLRAKGVELRRRAVTKSGLRTTSLAVTAEELR